MKGYLTLIIGLATVFSSCEENNAASGDLLGVWLLTEVLIDPGDGSGTFQPTDDDYKITFLEDGKLWMDQGLFCAPSLKLFIDSNGAYDTSRNVIVSHECATSEFIPEYQYELNDQNELIVRFPQCIEPCASKFIKISSE